MFVVVEFLESHFPADLESKDRMTDPSHLHPYVGEGVLSV